MSFYSNIENPEEKENYNFNIEKNIIKPNDSFYNFPQSNSQFQIIIPVESNSSKMDICSDNNQSSNKNNSISSNKKTNSVKNKEKLCDELDNLDLSTLKNEKKFIYFEKRKKKFNL